MGLFAKFMKETARHAPSVEPGSQQTILESDLAALPAVVQRYMRFMGVLGRPRDWSFRAGFLGRFKTKAEAPWRRCEVWQYDVGAPIARLFYMRIALGRVLPVIGRDLYCEGRGRLVVRLLDQVTVVDAKGPELDAGELVTYLNDLVLIAPSMLLGPNVSWRAGSDETDSFDVSLTDAGRTVTAHVSVDAHGAPVNFETDDRFFEDAKHVFDASGADGAAGAVGASGVSGTADASRWRRTHWSTPRPRFEALDGRQVLAQGRAVWHLPGLELPYAEFELVPGSLVFNVRPGE
ncbi:MAG: hypothetical protein H6729_13350 [Deltaproteobacteria bacterium]|nr:hypothetical protein [Deltaproteobacteria bacterium]